MTSKIHSEIYWPLLTDTKLWKCDFERSFLLPYWIIPEGWNIVSMTKYRNKSSKKKNVKTKYINIYAQ